MLLPRWRKSKSPRVNRRGEVYNIYLLQDEGKQNLCIKTLDQYLQETTEEDLELEWLYLNIKGCIERAVIEALGTTFQKLMRTQNME